MNEKLALDVNSVYYKGYVVRATKGPLIFDPDSFEPKQILNAEVYVPIKMHGNRSMPNTEISIHESLLVDKIIMELRPALLDYIKTINPYQRQNANE